MQHTIALTFIMEISNKDLSDNSLLISSEKFPYPPHHENQMFVSFISEILPVFVVISYILISPTLIKAIVYEKELGMKELMKLMGLPGWIQWSGWFTTAFLMMTLSAVIIVMFLCVRADNDAAVLNKTAPELLLIVFLFYIASSIAFCLFISSFFSRPVIASFIGTIIWALSYFLPNYLILGTKAKDYRRLTLCHKLSLGLLPNMALTLAVKIISDFEKRNIGLQWNVLDSPGYPGDNLTVLHLLMMMSIDVILYITLTLYVDQVYPGLYGIKKPWYFPFTKRFWKPAKPTSVEDSNTTLEDIHNFESEPIGFTPIIVIKNLSKEFSNKILAVDDINLNIYENQITALLGHNGAGKTTTMSMLTGMFPPSSGTALINGYDIRENVESARESIGLCPQHNIFFEELTVYEHIQFFGRLKGIPKENLNKDITHLLNQLGLMVKRNTYPRQLSGGMKRKLNLAISLIGHPKVIILDEPTSGMDPEARRAVWDLLGEYRSGCSILLTTHSMEEADILADRIAIMAQGKIHCCGSSDFLKKKYGAGYHLDICKMGNFDKTNLVLLLRRHSPSSELISENAHEVSFVLPSDDTSYFPTMLEEMDSKSEELGIQSFGISLTTMEEVFLRVGELTEHYQSITEENVTSSATALSLDHSEPELHHNLGFRLYIQQIRALLRKRALYSMRRWSLLIAQIIMPLLGIILCMVICNAHQNTDILLDDPPLMIDMFSYGKTIAIESHTDDTEDLAKDYATAFPPNTNVKRVTNTTEYLIDVGINDILSYTDQHIIGARINSNSITALHNRLYRHSAPLSLNMIHNALIVNATNSTDWQLTIENFPLPMESPMFMKESNQVLWVFGGMITAIGLTFLASSFVVFIVEESVTSSKHVQLMTGVHGLLFWGCSFLWDFLITVTCALCFAIILPVLDKTKLLSGPREIGVIFLSVLLYGYSSIPFAYVLSFNARSSTASFTRLTLLSLFVCTILNIASYILNMVQSRKFQIFKWVFRLIPSYPMAVILRSIPEISIRNSECKPYEKKLDMFCSLPLEEIPYSIRRCCSDICSEDCFQPFNMFASKAPGILEELAMLLFDCFLYFFILFLLHCNYIQLLCEMALNLWKARHAKKQEDIELTSYLDEDVNNETILIKNVIKSGFVWDYTLIVDDLTKHFYKLTPVNHLNFGVQKNECFGLLGVNGAGKTTTFRMLTGDIIISEGNAHLNFVSIKEHQKKFLSNIGYCPQVDPLINYLTGRETLILFARLRGIEEIDIKPEVERMISKFDLTKHADKITKNYSGGTKRKLSAAIAFLGHSTSSIILLDEPTTGVDPIARRRLWQIIKDAITSGTAVILTSHSMEECEALCSRVAIMVNGQFQCLGGIQHLKNKFSHSYTLKVKLSCVDEKTENALRGFLSEKFQECELKDSNQGLLHFQLKDEVISWRHLFLTMEEAKTSFSLADYTLSQATLEQVFLSFAQKQNTTS